ncbi:hypothetical protein NECAME_13664 [Necator americanus]|uniref:Uncharacterized protein n=1 Tax=Necator americanus TaxID=51031 RepID=W2STL4_NECAM|nr:hypothetical protein NECAME_13664 [Necator americanus]ETN72970.1 hypothetical protein NECAME_13664 [Necator americanus]
MQTCVTFQIRVIMNIIGEELRQWENALHSISKPGIFAVARRMIVHPKFTKSYAYNTFVTLNNLGVEVKIFDGSNEIIQWIQKSLKITFKSGIFESEAVFTTSGSQENKGEEMYLRFHSEKPKMKFCSIGKSLFEA